MNPPIQSTALGLIWLLSPMAMACNPPSGPGSAVQPQSKHKQQAPAVPLSSVPSADSQVAIAPYWVSLGSTGGTLAWSNRSETADKISVTNLADGSTQTWLGPETLQAFVRMDNLIPDTDYRWQLESGHSKTKTHGGEFTTLRSEPVRNFAVVGHTHGTEHFRQYPDHLLAARIAQSRPDFVIHTGDCVYFSTPKGWNQDFFRVFRPVLERAPIYISPGNHDSGWPFIDGLDLRPFQKLFPHAYPKEIQGTPGAAYYSIVQGPVHFLFLSYVTDLGPGSPQHAWIRETLRSSTSEFRIVVLGGANIYYDQQALRTLLTEEDVHAVLRGDGSAPKKLLSQPTDYPIFTLGTANAAPHPWLDASATPEHVVFRQLDAMGKPGPVHWIHSKRKRPEVLLLGEPVPRNKKNEILLYYKLPEPISSEKVRGLQFEVEGVDKGKLAYYLMARPQTRLSKGEAGFRSNFGSLEAKDKMIAVPIAAQRPIRGGAYNITEIQLKLSGTDAHPNVNVKRAWLY